MPRHRKYDYQKDYPVRFRLHFSLPVEVANALDDLGYDYERMSKEVQEYFTNIVEKSKKKNS
jgi:hypothetical protein